MSNYYRWTENLNDDDALMLTTFELVGLDEWDLTSGRKIDSWSEENAATYDEEGVARDLLCTINQTHVVSTRLKNALESIPIENVQFLPLSLAHENDREKTLDGYHLLNPLAIDCLDRDRSDVLVWGDDEHHAPGDLRDVRNPVLTKIGTRNIFRVAGWEVYLVVEETVKTAIEKTDANSSVFTKFETI